MTYKYNILLRNNVTSPHHKYMKTIYKPIIYSTDSYTIRGCYNT